MPKYRWYDQGRPKPQPNPNARFFAWFEWAVIIMVILWMLAGWLQGQPLYEFERISERRDRVCAAKLPAVEKIAEVRGVIAAGKESERCAFFERSAEADRDDVIRRVGALVEAAQ